MKIEILEDYDCLETPEGNTAFGVYDTENNKIYVAGDLDRINVVELILHELAHYYQIKDNKEPKENEADNMVLKWLDDLREIYKERIKG